MCSQPDYIAKVGSLCKFFSVKLHLLVNNFQKISFVYSFIDGLYSFVCDLVVKITNFENFDYRSVIKFLSTVGTALKDIHQSLVSVYGDRAPSKTTVKNLGAEFNSGRESIEDDPPIGRPVEVTTAENFSAVELLVMTDR